MLGSPDGPSTTTNKTHFRPGYLLRTPLINYITTFLILFFNVSVPGPLFTALGCLNGVIANLSLVCVNVDLSITNLTDVHFSGSAIIIVLIGFILDPTLATTIFKVTTNVNNILPTVTDRAFVIRDTIPAVTILPVLTARNGNSIACTTGLIAVNALLFIVIIPTIVLLVSWKLLRKRGYRRFSSLEAIYNQTIILPNLCNL